MNYYSDKIAKIATKGSFFIYYLDVLRANATKVAAGEAKIFFACKANPLSSILISFRDIGIGFDITSIGELRHALSLGITGDVMIITGPAKTEPLLRLALEHKVGTFVIESHNQLVLLQQLAREYSYEPSVLLRLQLRWDSDKEDVLGGNKITQFGVDLATARILLSNIKLPFLGFHVFQWSNILSIERLRDIWDTTIRACQNLTKDFSVLDVGGGLGIPYHNSEKELQWNPVNSIVKELKQIYQLKEFWIESGRYLVAPYGIYITSVIDRKRNYGRDMLILEGGINHIARTAMSLDYILPTSMLRKSQAAPIKFALHGPLCTSVDYLGDHMLPGDCDVGDVIAFHQIGGYAFTEGLSFSLCHNLAGEAVVEQGQVKIVREPEPAQLWLR